MLARRAPDALHVSWSSLLEIPALPPDGNAILLRFAAPTLDRDLVSNHRHGGASVLVYLLCNADLLAITIGV